VSTTSLSFGLFARDHASGTFAKFGTSVSNANKQTGLLRSGVAKLAAGFAGLAVISKTTQYLKDSVTQAREAQKVGALTNAVIRSTGGVANVTAGQVEALANSLSLKAGVDDEAIQSGSNLLLTFTNIRNEVGRGNDIFNQATTTALDMSAALGKDMRSASLMLGKALNNPIAGLTALGRAGVQFTDQQKDQITALVESGRTMDAQKAILAELQTQFGGAAASQATAGDKARVAWENLQEQIGNQLLPILDRLLAWFVADALPAIQRFGGFLEGRVLPVLARMAEFIQRNMDVIRPLAGVLAAVGAGVLVVTTATKAWAAAQAALNAIMAANPIGIVVVALAGLAAAFVVAYKKSETFRELVGRVLDRLKTVMAGFVRVARALWARFGDNIVTIARGAWKIISSVVQGALKVIKGIINVFVGALTGDWRKAWAGVKQVVAGVWQTIKGIIDGTLKVIKGLLGDAWSAIKGTAATAWDRITEAVSRGVKGVLGAVRGVATDIVDFFADLPEKLYDIGVHALQALINGLGSLRGALQTLAADIAVDIAGTLAGALKIGSPSRVMMELGQHTGEGFRLGLEKSMAGVKAPTDHLTVSSGAHRLARPAVDGGAPAGSADVRAMRRVLEGMTMFFEMPDGTRGRARLLARGG